MNIAVFSSHNGTDLQATIDACKNGRINARVCVVISNNASSAALSRARTEGIDAYNVSLNVYPDEKTLDEKVLDILSSHNTDIIFLAGFLKKIGMPVLKKYQGRIFNIHPALLPKFGGKGMYGINVHTAVINAGETVSGITVHRVSAEYDEGEIVAQTTVEVLSGDTPEVLAARILEREHTFIVEVLRDIINGKIVTDCF